VNVTINRRKSIDAALIVLPAFEIRHGQRGNIHLNTTAQSPDCLGRLFPPLPTKTPVESKTWRGFLFLFCGSESCFSIPQFSTIFHAFQKFHAARMPQECS